MTIKDDTSNENKQKKNKKSQTFSFHECFLRHNITSRYDQEKRFALLFFFYRTLVFKKKGVKNRSFTKKEKRYYHP